MRNCVCEKDRIDPSIQRELRIGIEATRSGASMPKAAAGREGLGKP
jgi:hypothetical protein